MGKQLRGLTEKLSTAADPSSSGRFSSGEDSGDDTCDVALAIQEIALRPKCVILSVVCLKCNLLLHLLLHLLPSQSQSPKSSHLIAS